MFAQVLKLQGVGKCRERLPPLGDLHVFLTLPLSQHHPGHSLHGIDAARPARWGVSLNLHVKWAVKLVARVHPPSTRGRSARQPEVRYRIWDRFYLSSLHAWVLCISKDNLATTTTTTSCLHLFKNLHKITHIDGSGNFAAILER